MGFPRPQMEQPMVSVSFLVVQEGLQGFWLFEQGMERGMESQKVGTRIQARVQQQVQGTGHQNSEP